MIDQLLANPGSYPKLKGGGMEEGEEVEVVGFSPPPAKAKVQYMHKPDACLHLLLLSLPSSWDRRGDDRSDRRRRGGGVVIDDQNPRPSARSHAEQAKTQCSGGHGSSTKGAAGQEMTLEKMQAFIDVLRRAEDFKVVMRGARPCVREVRV